VNSLIYGPYYRAGMDKETVNKIFQNKELWGTGRRNTCQGLNPAVKAYMSRDERKGWWIMFTTEVPPDPKGCAPPGEIQWSGERPGVEKFDKDNVEYVKIKLLAVEYCIDE
jgi:hypothetical protein